MVPINEVLISKIVLGYLSSRNLSGTADYFVKECAGFHSSSEPGTCEKERILNHLEGLNLLPSLEDILKDYFAYQGPDEGTNDKVYMLWKQVDVVIGQLRAITMGKARAKAFMHSRRAPRTFNKLINKNENINQPDTNQFIGNENSNFSRHGIGLQNAQKVYDNQMEKESTSLLQEDSSVKSTHPGVLTTPIKEAVKKDKKEFRSPRRKPRHPHHVTTSTEELVKCSTFEVISEAPLNREFSDLVAALISNDKLSAKLADNINKVVSVETKPLSKYDDIDEIIKLTADDPDLNVLFQMLGGPYPHSSQDDTQHHANEHFDINAAIASPGLDMETSKLSNYIELQPIVTSASNSKIEIVNSNLRPSFTCMESVDKLNITQTGDTNLQPFLMQDPTITNFLDILNPYNSSYPCMRDLGDEFSDYSNKMETSYEPLHLPLQESSSVPKTVEKTTSVTSQADDKLPLPNSSLITSPQLQSSTCCKSPHGTEVKDSNNIEKKRVDDNVILASHALLQLSTSPMKLSTTSTVENVISMPIVSPQALASNRKISRELICSTKYTLQDNPVDINDIANDIVTQSNQSINSQNVYLLSDPNHCNKIYSIKQNDVVSDVITSKDDRKHARKKCSKIKKCNTDIPGENISIPQGENEDTLNKKTKRKEITVTQLDFNPAIPSTPINRLNQPRKEGDNNGINNNNNNDNTLFDGSVVPLSQTSVDINIPPKIVVTDRCDKLSPASLLHAQLKTLKSKNSQTVGESSVEINCMNRSSSMPYADIKPAVTEEGIYSKCSIVKPTSDQFQTFRITGNAISKVVNLDRDKNESFKIYDNISDAKFSCKSKIAAISMVINNTNSLNKITDSNALATNNLSKGIIVSPNKIQVRYDPSELKCSIDNTNASHLRSTDSSSSYIDIRKNCFMPSILPGEKGTNDYLGLGVPSDGSSREKEKDSVASRVKSKCDPSTSTSKKDTTSNVVKVDPSQNISSNSYTPQSFTKREDNESSQIVGKHPSEKRGKNNTTPAARGGGKISKKRVSKKRVKSYSMRSSRNPPSKKMTVKFNFNKSPTKKKHFSSEVEEDTISADTIKRQEAERVHICDTSSDTSFEIVPQKEDCESHKDLVMSKIEPLSYPVTTTVCDQETVHTQSFLECLKRSCNIIATPSDRCENKFIGGEEKVTTTNIDTTSTSTPDFTPIDFSIIGTTTNDCTRTDTPNPNIPKTDILTIPSDIPTSDIPTSDIQTSDVPSSDIATTPLLQVSSSVSQPSQVLSENNNILNEGTQQTGKIKRKAKRKRNLSLLLTVDNVAQLLSGIDYS